MPSIIKSSNVKLNSDYTLKVELDKNKNLNEDSVSESHKLTCVDSARDEADFLISQAKREADSILALANLKADSIIFGIEASNKNGYNEGYEKGYAEGLEIAEKLKEEAKSIVENAEIEKKNILDSIEPEILQIIVDITEKLIFKTAEIDKNVVSILIKTALAGLTVIDNVVIRVSTDDYLDVVKNKQEIICGIEGLVNIEIIKDLSLDTNDCIIETSYGNIDCSLKNQFASLKSDLFYLLETR